MMMRIISAFIFAITATMSHADAPPLELADQVPSQYTVVRGDTLWDISGRFLKEPWRWPEIWRMNKAQIKNPHLIYPGDVILLERDANGKPYLRLRARSRSGARSQSPSVEKLSPKIYEESLTEAIPPIPPGVIEPFLSTPLIVENDAMEGATRIVATQEGRVFLGNGDTAYVTNADPAQKQ